VAIIMLGMMMIFIYYQKMIQLYRLQQNFINGFTHELKTPIASIQLFVETFLKHELKRDEQIKYLEFMKRDAERLSQNVNRILHLAKLEDKTFQANFEEKDLVLVINKLLKSTPHLFDTVEINFQHNRETILMKLDVSLFEMLLMNLITNGILYNKSERKKIEINLNQSDKKISLTVLDNGLGVEKSEQKKIFKKFYQVGKATKGSGLGLYIVASIVKLHHGEIKIESEGHQLGAKFIMEFKI
jgi:signal transduction histidine kinase